MSNPLGDATRHRLTDAAAARLTADGFEVVRPDTRAEPPAIAVQKEVEKDDATPLDGEPIGSLAGNEPFGVEPLTADDVTPTTVVSRLGHAIERDRRALFVVANDEIAESVRSVLADPPLVVDERAGRRTFYAGPDRIPVDTTALRVDTGGYACVRVDDMNAVDSTPTFHWRETDTPLGPVSAVSGVDAAAVEADGAPAVPRLVCEVGERVIAVLAGVESLRTPPAAAFPYFYRRDPSDKRFRVRRGDDGTVVESVSGFAAMHAAGFVPIPMPLVPEHVLAIESSLPGESNAGSPRVESRWDLLVVGDGNDDPGSDTS